MRAAEKGPVPVNTHRRCELCGWAILPGQQVICALQGMQNGGRSVAHAGRWGIPYDPFPRFHAACWTVPFAAFVRQAADPWYFVCSVCGGAVEAGTFCVYAEVGAEPQPGAIAPEGRRLLVACHLACFDHHWRPFFEDARRLAAVPATPAAATPAPEASVKPTSEAADETDYSVYGTMAPAVRARRRAGFAPIDQYGDPAW